eukprot:IDg19587t1
MLKVWIGRFYYRGRLEEENNHMLILFNLIIFPKTSSVNRAGAMCYTPASGSNMQNRPVSLLNQSFSSHESSSFIRNGRYHAPQEAHNVQKQPLAQLSTAPQFSQHQTTANENSQLPMKHPQNEVTKFNAADLKKLHLQLRHGTATEMRNWIRAGGRWFTELDPHIRDLLLACNCKVAYPPKLHPA